MVNSSRTLPAPAAPLDDIRSSPSTVMTAVTSIVQASTVIFWNVEVSWAHTARSAPCSLHAGLSAEVP